MGDKYDITVIYELHESGGSSFPAFPAQSVAAERIQLLSVCEEDSLHPRRAAMQILQKAEGRYTILLDVGDRFSDNFLEEMLAQAQTSCAFVMPSLISQLVWRRVPFFSMSPRRETILLNAGEALSIYPTDLHGLLIPTENLQKALRAADGQIEEEKQILVYLLRQNPDFVYLGSCSLEYRFPMECDHQYDIRTGTREWYFDPFEQFLLPLLRKEDQAPDNVCSYVQYLALYMVNTRFTANQDNANKAVLQPEEVPAYTEFLSGVLRLIKEDTIADPNAHPTNSSLGMKLMELRMKKGDWNWYPAASCTETTLQLTDNGSVVADLSKIMAYIQLIDFTAGHLEIDGYFPDVFKEDKVNVYAQFKDRKLQPVYNRRYSLTKFFGVSFFRMKTFHLSIPVPDEKEERMLNFYIQPEGQKAYRMEFAFPSHTSRFARDFTYGYWRFGSYLAFWNQLGIHILRSNPLLVLRKELCLWIQIYRNKNGRFRSQLPLKMLNFLLRPWFSRQKIWLFFDKIYKGGDSSEYMYKYAVKQNDGIKKYYLLDPSSADYARLKREGYRPLRRNSLKHRLIFLNADMVIASNSTVFAFNGYDSVRTLPIRGDTHFDVACVQHGMSVQKIAVAQQRLRDNTKLYFCASKYEIENLSRPVYDYAGYDALKLTGVPRYDGLENRAEKILLFSPTWRMNSALAPNQNNGEGVARDYNPHFKETNYYKVYNGLLNDPRLLSAARQYGYRIQYVLHPIISPQLEDFTKNDDVEIIPSIGDMSYEKLFCEAALMVTDFSGVQFDFAYMRKPVIYLHHRDIPQHYEEGSFFYETMGFGEICHTNEELINVLVDYMKNDCRMPEKYRRRADDFFAYSDHRNCERIYPIMLEHERHRER